MIKNKVSINIISSFNHSNFVGLLRNSPYFDWQINEVDYNQVFQTLTNPNARIWSKKADITLVERHPGCACAVRRAIDTGTKNNLHRQCAK